MEPTESDREGRTAKPVRLLQGSESHRAASGEDLHRCPACDSPLVQPTSSSLVEAGCWWVDRRCPNCFWEGGGIYPQRVVDRFEEILDEGTVALRSATDRLGRSNREEELRRFADALACDRILPEDF